jgi:polysaccharide deacetylase family protein (PEP-CTERM system associated)
MNILTFDIEDWYNCDFEDVNLNWDRHEVRIYEGVDRILEELDTHKLKASFFCLGWLAEKHPQVIKKIHKQGHHIGCHSYQHQLAYKFTKDQFRNDTNRAKKLLEDVTGVAINAYRAPGFSITKKNISYFEIISDLGFLYDASVFPATHDYGGLPKFGDSLPYIIESSSGILKEFPMSTYNMFGKHWVFSGGGFFRILPYPIIEILSKKSKYLMTYFHPRDFDADQPVINSLSFNRKFKSYIGLNRSFSKFKRYINNFDFVSIEKADIVIDWSKSSRVRI